MCPEMLSAQERSAEKNEWTFIVVNDLHYSEPACRLWFDQIVAAMKASAPDAEFCLLGGDLADSGTFEQMAGVHAAFGALDIPCYATPGNHDYLSDNNRHAYEHYFPSQSNQFIRHREWQLLGLDTSDGTRYENTRIGADTLTWLDEKRPLLDPAAPTLVWTHFPLAPVVRYCPLNADELLTRLSGLNVQAIFSGHWHSFTENTWQQGVLTTNWCCSRVRSNHDGTKEKGWFVCTARDGRVSRQFVEIPHIA